jgi:hypothetical protein
MFTSISEFLNDLRTQDVPPFFRQLFPLPNAKILTGAERRHGMMARDIKGLCVFELMATHLLDKTFPGERTLNALIENHTDQIEWQVSKWSHNYSQMLVSLVEWQRAHQDFTLEVVSNFREMMASMSVVAPPDQTVAETLKNVGRAADSVAHVAINANHMAMAAHWKREHFEAMVKADELKRQVRKLLRRCTTLVNLNHKHREAKYRRDRIIKALRGRLGRGWRPSRRNKKLIKRQRFHTRDASHMAQALESFNEQIVNESTCVTYALRKCCDLY